MFEYAGINMNTLHGELYLDDEGEAHFICHTPGNMPFDEVRAALAKFIELLEDQVDRQAECPYFAGIPSEQLPL